ncbi:hypothetical protein CBS12448_2461 [Aspergillus niger]|nr:hypothetical protein CBS11350_4842 [Aspergillus niger]KAI2864834.1 hypothetical protein CBS12448_2461 [Aspergillus niger]KAI2977386.1 hypothetical protein CBS147324_2060 [Aspergillus niger]KAI3018476.1 hypothetical protein CBS147482_2518 [Aspergillus niger]KAI3055429.1 hypothetical protein CBS147352_2882 [Aspergillus niger]
MTSARQPTGWLDIHGHFQVPKSEAAAREGMKAFHQACFLVQEPYHWQADETLRYNDTAGVQLQMLSAIPPGPVEGLRQSNDYGAQMVRQWPGRFGLLAGLPTDNPDACLEEIQRVTNRNSEHYRIPADGFATSTVYNGVSLADPRLRPVWEELHTRRAVVHIHPNALAPPQHGLPAPLVEVALDTTRTVVAMLYQGVFRDFPDIVFVLGHCGAAVPVLSGRLALLGTENWVPNPQGLRREDVEAALRRLYVDTAATAKTGLAPAVHMCGVAHCVYGSDCGVPCSTATTMDENRSDVGRFEMENGIPPETIGMNGWRLFPAAAERACQHPWTKEAV